MNLFSEKSLYEAEDILADAVERYKPTHIFGMFSGGRDSLTACHFASKLPGFSGCFHANTGIGIERTREYVRQTCREQSWPLIELKSDDTYEWFVSNYGFPGPAMHGIIYTYLKERCVRELVRLHKANRLDHIMLVSGVRQQESKRRMGYDDPVTKHGCQIWANPVFYWNKQRRDDFIKDIAIETNPVADALGMSGECLCGAFAGSKGGLPEDELKRIAIIDPSIPKEIDRLTEIAKAHGKPCRWGYPPPPESESEIREALELEGQTFMPLCSSCVFTKEK